MWSRTSRGVVVSRLDGAYRYGFVDIVAEKDGRWLYAEVTGATEPGLDVHTAFGQLVRRMPSEPNQSVSFALVVSVRARFGVAPGSVLRSCGTILVV